MAFLIPAIPWLIGVLLATGVAVGVREVLASKAGKKTLAILGDEKSGKSTFTKLLVEGIVGSGEYTRTIVDGTYPGKTITFSNGTKLHVGDFRDLPGEHSAWILWKKRVQESDYVLYMVKSHALRKGSKGARDRCRRDLQQLKLWLDDIAADSRPEVVLIFSFRDQDKSVSLPTIPYADEVIATAGVKPTVDAIARITRLQYVSGSLASSESATDLLDELGAAL